MRKNQHTYHLHIELREDEYRKMLADLETSRLSRSTYIRKLIKNERIKARPTVEIRDLYTEVNRIGNNINQIARSVNAEIASQETAAQAVFLMRKVYDLMERVADR